MRQSEIQVGAYYTYNESKYSWRAVKPRREGSRGNGRQGLPSKCMLQCVEKQGRKSVFRVVDKQTGELKKERWVVSNHTAIVSEVDGASSNTSRSLRAAGLRRQIENKALERERHTDAIMAIDDWTAKAHVRLARLEQFDSNEDELEHLINELVAKGGTAIDIVELMKEQKALLRA